MVPLCSNFQTIASPMQARLDGGLSLETDRGLGARRARISTLAPPGTPSPLPQGSAVSPSSFPHRRPPKTRTGSPASGLRSTEWFGT
jgi:hypothetical protein